MDNEMNVAARLDRPLDDGSRRFLSDRSRSRNRFDSDSKMLEVSSVFDRYGEDFEKGHRGGRQLGNVFATFATHADVLADSAANCALLRCGKARAMFVDYDWRLNGAPR